jgi:hypothetical protein
MVESQQVLEWINEGQAKMLLRVLKARFGAVPAELEAKIRALTDEQQLERWGELAATATSLKQFRQQAQV